MLSAYYAGNVIMLGVVEMVQGKVLPSVKK